MLLPHPEDKENSGQAVLARGPLVYCLEQVDAGFPVGQARWAFGPEQVAERVRVEWKPGLLGGLNVLTVPGEIGGDEREEVELTLAPFYARANRSDDNHWMTYLPLR